MKTPAHDKVTLPVGYGRWTGLSVPKRETGDIGRPHLVGESDAHPSQRMGPLGAFGGFGIEEEPGAAGLMSICSIKHSTCRLPRKTPYLLRLALCGRAPS
jgi:hypothetical protein